MNARQLKKYLRPEHRVLGSYLPTITMTSESGEKCTITRYVPSYKLVNGQRIFNTRVVWLRVDDERGTVAAKKNGVNPQDLDYWQKRLLAEIDNQLYGEM